MNKVINKINMSRWNDWTLDKLEIDYDKVIIKVSEELEGAVEILCNDYIGFSFVGHWDECVIEKMEVTHKGKLIEDSINTVIRLHGEHPLPGGGVKNIEDSWYQINVRFIDGNSIYIACKSIDIRN